MDKRKNDKSGVLRTLEVVVAIVMSIIALLYILPVTQSQSRQVNIPDYLPLIDSFRNAVVANDSIKALSIVDDYLSPLYPDYDFNLSISSNPNYIMSINSSSNIHSRTFFICGNITKTDFYFVRVYYWKR